MEDTLEVRIDDSIGPERRSEDMDYLNPSQAGTCGMVSTTRISQIVHNRPKLPVPAVKLQHLATARWKSPKILLVYGCLGETTLGGGEGKVGRCSNAPSRSTKSSKILSEHQQLSGPRRRERQPMSSAPEISHLSSDPPRR